MRDLPEYTGGERVQLYGTNSHALYFVVHAGEKHGSATVLLYKGEVFSCLTDVGSHERDGSRAHRCPHTKLVAEFWSAQTADAQAALVAAVAPGDFAPRPDPAVEPEPVAVGVVDGTEQIEWLL